MDEFSKVVFDYVGLKTNNFIFQDQIAKKNKGLQYVWDPSKIQNKCIGIQFTSYNDLVPDMIITYIHQLEYSGQSSPL